MKSNFPRAALAALLLAAIGSAACNGEPTAVTTTPRLQAALADDPPPPNNPDSPPLIGDCNGDWKIDERDPQQMEDMNGPIDPQDQFRVYQSCDIDADLRVDAKDAEIVWTYLKEGKSSFPIGWPATCPDLTVVGTSHEYYEDESELGPVHLSATIANLGTMTFRWSDTTEFLPRVVLTDGTWKRLYMHYGPPSYTDMAIVGTPPFAASPPTYHLFRSLGSTTGEEAFERRALGPWLVDLWVNPRNALDGNPSNDDCNLLNNSAAGETPRRPSPRWGTHYPY